MQREITMAAMPPPLIPPCFFVETGVVSPLACVGVDLVVGVFVVVRVGLVPGVVVVGFMVVFSSLLVIQTYC